MIFRTQANETRTVREAAKGRAAGRPAAADPIHDPIRRAKFDLARGGRPAAPDRDEIAITNLAGSSS